MDVIQILLMIVLVVSTIFLAVVGIQLVLVLHALKKTLGNLNKIVSGFDTIGIGLKHGIGEATGFINGFKTIIKIVDLYANRKEK